MDKHSRVRLTDDPQSEGIVIQTQDEGGRTKFRVSWDNDDEMTWHYKPELEELPSGARNQINGPVTGSVIQAGTIIGGININKK